MKFVNDRRSDGPSNTKSVLNIKTLMTGKQTVRTGKRSTQVLVNEGPSLQKNSLAFTTLDPTEAPSFTSLSSSAAHSENNDPYLVNHGGRFRSKYKPPVSLSLEEVIRSNAKNKEATSSLSNPVITFSNIEETSQISLSNDSSPRPAAAPQPTTKLSSLGAFNFPLTAETPAKLTVSLSKSLGSGCFQIPSSEAEVALFEGDKAPKQDPQGFSFSSPLSAIGTGLQTLGALALPRVLQFDLHRRQSPPSTPVSQAVEEEPVSMTTTRHHIKVEQECDFWNQVVTNLIQTYGKNHVKTAEGLHHLGHAYMKSREYAQAVVTFQSVCRIWNRLERTKDDRLAFARVVDAIGMAWARVSHEDDRDHCQKAMTALEEAFQIRYELLGPWAIDTVETLNKIASVHLHLRDYSEACNAYWEVFWSRRAIFGADHPSVAVVAHALGNVLVKLASTKDAANFFQIAVDIYGRMDLPDKHPAVSRLMRDYKRLDRICLTSRIPKQERQGHR